MLSTLVQLRLQNSVLKPCESRGKGAPGSGFSREGRHTRERDHSTHAPSMLQPHVPSMLQPHAPSVLQPHAPSILQLYVPSILQLHAPFILQPHALAKEITFGFSENKRQLCVFNCLSLSAMSYSLRSPSSSSPYSLLLVLVLLCCTAGLKPSVGLTHAKEALSHIPWPFHTFIFEMESL